MRWILRSVGREDAGESWTDLEGELLRMWRQAIAVQLLTPACDKQSLVWKQRAVKADKYIPIDPEALARVMAEDEAWLAAHHPQRAKRQAAKPVLALVA